MSIVAMKRKSRGYNNPVSSQGFSLNGGYRNQGWVGQTSISRPVHRTLFKGNLPVGHGGQMGSYNVSIQSGNMCSANDHNIIKPSTLSTKGYIHRDCSCHQDTVKLIDPLQSSQDIYIKNLSDKLSSCVVEKPASENTYIYNCSLANKNSASHFIGGKKVVVKPYSKNVSSLSYGEYIKSIILKKKCISEPPKLQLNTC